MPATFTTQVQVANLALNMLGANQISSFLDGTREAELMNNYYELYVRQALQKFDWRFAIGEMQCSLLATSPVPQWQYGYEMPADMLNLKAVYMTNDAGDRMPYKRYELFENNTLCTDTGNGIWVYYKKRVFESRWPAYFIDFVTYHLAIKFCNMLGRQFDLQNQLLNITYNSGGDAIYNSACAIDAMQYPPEELNAYYLQTQRWSY